MSKRKELKESMEPKMNKKTDRTLLSWYNNTKSMYQLYPTKGNGYKKDAIDIIETAMILKDELEERGILDPFGCIIPQEDRSNKKRKVDADYKPPRKAIEKKDKEEDTDSDYEPEEETEPVDAYIISENENEK